MAIAEAAQEAAAHLSDNDLPETKFEVTRIEITVSPNPGPTSYKATLTPKDTEEQLVVTGFVHRLEAAELGDRHVRDDAGEPEQREQAAAQEDPEHEQPQPASPTGPKPIVVSARSVTPRS